MSAYPNQGPLEEKRPGFLHRPVPMWAFLLLVIILILILFVPAFLIPCPPRIQQPLLVTPESRTVFINVTQISANFSVSNLNATNTLSATATATLSPPNVNVTLTISGVQTGNSFVVSSDGKTVSFPPGVNTLIVTIDPTNNMMPGNYTVELSLLD